MTNEILSYVKLRKEFDGSSGKIEEFGKILEKICGLGPTRKKTPLERIVEQVDDAPERLKYMNEVTNSN